MCASSPVETAEHLDPEHAPPAHGRVVVQEADHLLVRRLGELAREGTARAAGADDQDAPALAAAPELAELGQQPQHQARAATSDDAEQRVDEEDLEREGLERLQSPRRSPTVSGTESATAAAIASKSRAEANRQTRR